MKKMIAMILTFSLALSGCGVLKDPPATTIGVPGPEENTPPQGGMTIQVDFETTDEEMFTDRDQRTEYDAADSVIIQLNGSSVTCNSASVKVEGTAVTVAGEGTYILRGTLENGSVTVQAGETEKVQLVLEGAQITCADSAALNIQSGDKVFVTLAEGTENCLSNGGSFTDSQVDGAIYSTQDLTLNGTGKLTVESPAAHGIVCKDDLVVTGGTYQIHSAFHALDANDSFRAKGATLTLDAGKDGIHVEDNDDPTTGFVYISGGSLEIEAEGDGISGGVWMQISGGTFGILAGGGHENGESHNSGGYGDFMGGGPGGGPGGGHRPRAATTTDSDSVSMKGLKADGGILISGGTLTIDAADDAIHSNGITVINNGSFEIFTGDDAIHAETDLQISGGTVNIPTCYEGLEAQNVRVTGGNISMVATDDGINAAGGNDASGSGGRDQMYGPPGMPSGNGSIVIDGGELYIRSSGDGMDANGYVEINGGKTVVCGPNNGDTATLDYDTSGTINGGIFIGTGSSMMAQTFSDNAQGVLALQVGNQNAETTITVTDADGKVLLTHQPELAFSVFIYSAPELKSGQTYRITVGDSAGDMQAY